MIAGELVTDDEPEPEPVREIMRRPKVVTRVADEDELRRMARERGGLGGCRPTTEHERAVGAYARPQFASRLGAQVGRIVVNPA